jgi:hypothetical protein
LHAIAVDDEPFPVALPHLPVCGLDHLTAAATVDGQPDDEWIATLVAPAVARGLGALAESSRATGIEAAGRIVARVGFDPTRRRFVRVLERLIVSRATHASATRVVSTAASWGDYLTEVPREGPQAIASVHTHVHLTYDGSGADGAPGDHLLVGGGGLSAAGDPCISLDDMLAHYRAFPDPLSAAVIVSVFPGRHEVRLYGYTPGAELRLEPGYWSLDGRELEV